MMMMTVAVMVTILSLPEWAADVVSLVVASVDGCIGDISIKEKRYDGTLSID